MKLVRIDRREACQLAQLATKQKISDTGFCLWEAEFYDNNGKLLVVFAYDDTDEDEAYNTVSFWKPKEN